MRARTKQAERGSIMAVSAFGMLAFLLAVGLCVDISHFYVVQAELQNGADAAALAGASALNSQPAGITQAATRAAAAMNSYEFNHEGIDIDESDVSFAVNFNGPYMDAASAQAVAENIRFVKVDVPAAPVGVVFAGLAMGGADTANIAAEATAGMSMPPNVFCDWIPLSVLDDPAAPTLIPGEMYVIRGGPHTSVSPGNRQILAIGGSGASVVRINLARGISECAEPGQVYEKDTKPGVDAGPVRDGLNTRFDEYSAGMEWQDFPPDVNVKEGITWEEYSNATPGSANWESPSPGHVGVPNRRVVVLPIISSSEFDPGRDTVTFWKFVAFFLKRKVPGGSGGDIEAEYIGERFVFGKGGFRPGGGPVNPQLAQPVIYR
jgi:Flp pilus assembly protein TadG